MKIFGTKPSFSAAGIKRNRSRIAGATAVVVFSSVIVGAVRANGDPGQRVKFNDGSVWETDRSTGRLTHLNLSADLSGSRVTVTRKAKVSIEQGSAGIVVVDQSANTLTVLDDQEIALSSSEVKLADDAVVRVGDERILVVSRKAGHVFLRTRSELASAETLDASYSLLSSSAPVMGELGADGSVHALVPSTGELRSWSKDGRPQSTVQLGRRSPRSQISAIGASPVVYDPDAKKVFVVGNETKILPVYSNEIVLSMPTMFSDLLVVADERNGGGLERLNFKGNAKSSRELIVPALGGRLVRPVVEENGCVFGASDGAGTIASWCPTSTAPYLRTLGKNAVFQARLVRGFAVIDDLESNRFVHRRADGKVGVIVSTAPDESPTDKSGDEGNDKGAKNSPDGVTGENQPPKANDDDLRVRPDRVSILPVLANDADPNGDALTVTSVDGVPGDATGEPASGDTGVVFRPRTGFRGTLTFRATVSDAGGKSDTANVRVTVTADGNEPPKTFDDTATATVGAASLIDVLANDIDPDGDSITVVSASLSEGSGEVSVSGSGLVSFRPSEGGTAKISYTVVDERGSKADGVLRLEVSAGQNLAPIARNDVYDVQIGRTAVLDVLANDLDPDGGQLTLVDVPASVNPLGSLQRDGNLIRLNPVQQGEQDFQYSVSDGTSSAQATVRLRVKAAVGNRAPVAVPDRVNLVDGESVAVDVVRNDTDADGDALGVASWTAPPGVEVSGSDGRVLRVKLTGALDPVVVVYELSDGSVSVPGTLLVTPVATAKNLAPIAVDENVGVRAGVGRIVNVLANDADPERDALRITRVIGAPPVGVAIGNQGRQVVIGSDGPVDDYAFQYEIADSNGQTATATVRVGVVKDPKANRVPTLRADRATVASGFVVSIAVLANDDDPDGDPLRITNPGLPQKGSVTEAAGVLRYEANPGALGTDRFTYVVEDGHGASAIAEVIVGVLPEPRANRPPTAVDDGPVRVEAGKSADVPVLNNDSDPDPSDTVSLQSVGVAPRGTAQVAGSVVTFTAPTELGVVKVPYLVADRAGATASATITFDVVAVQPKGVPPVANPDTAGPLSSGVAQTVRVLENDEDPDGDPATLRVVSASGSGASVAGGGVSVRVVGTGNPGSATYVVRDAQGNSATGTITIQGGQSTSLVAKDDTDAVAAGGTVEIDVLSNDVADAVDRPLRIAQVGTSDGGVAALLNGSKIRFTAKSGFSGQATFGYTVQDKSGKTATATVRVKVAAGNQVNRPPVAKAGGPLDLLPGESKTIDLAALGTDPEGGVLRFKLGKVPSQVSASLAETTLNVTAAADAAPWTGVVPFVVSDDKDATATSDVVVRVLSVATTLPRTTLPSSLVGPPTTLPAGPPPPSVDRATTTTLAIDGSPVTQATNPPGAATTALRSADPTTSLVGGTTPPTQTTVPPSAGSTTTTSEPRTATTTTVEPTTTSTGTTTTVPTTTTTAVTTTTVMTSTSVKTPAETTTSSTSSSTSTSTSSSTSSTSTSTSTSTSSSTTTTKKPDVNGTVSAVRSGSQQPCGGASCFRLDVRATGFSPPPTEGICTLDTNGVPSPFALAPDPVDPTVFVASGVCGITGSTGGTRQAVSVRGVSSNVVLGFALLPPTDPTGLTGSSPSASEVSLNWVASSSRAPLWYEVRTNRIDIVNVGTAAAYLASGLAAGTSYTFEVRACNANGCSASTAPLSVTTMTTTIPARTTTTTTTTTIPQRAPGAPGTPSGSAISTSQIQLSWGGPSDVGNPPLNRYVVRINGGQLVDVGGATSYTWGGLGAGTVYRFDVQACGLTCGPFGGGIDIATQQPPPPSPSILLEPGRSAVGVVLNPTTGLKCTHPSCKYFRVTLRDFPAGSYSVQCDNDTGGWGVFYTYAASAGSTTEVCIIGYPNSNNRVFVNGIVSNTVGGW